MSGSGSGIRFFGPVYVLTAGIYEMELHEGRFRLISPGNLITFLMCFDSTAFLKLTCGATLAAMMTFGCGKDGAEGEPPAGSLLEVSPSSLVFDPANPARNRVSVTSNGVWSVSVPAGLRVDAVTGTGDGGFTVTSAPVGSSELTVSLGTLVRTVVVTRTANPEAPELTLSPAVLEFDPEHPDKNVIVVRCDAVWTVSATAQGLSFTPDSGDGDGGIRVTAAPEGRTVLTVTAQRAGKKSVEQVEIVRAAGPLETIWSENFDLTPGYTGWANRSDSWKNPQGTGAASVTYDCAQAYVRNDGSSANRYEGASGKCHIRLFFDNDPFFTVQRIAPGGHTDLTLTFGAAFTAANCRLDVSADGDYWVPLSYTGAASYNVWQKLSVGFTLEEPAPYLYLRFTPQGTASYGVNFDDLRLSGGGGGQRISLRKLQIRWAELPSNFERPQTDQFVYTHWATTVKSNRRVRNYTYCYDTRRHNPVWVAYPLHACYAEGGYGRTNPDPWTYDPAPGLGIGRQSKIYGIDAGDVFQYWTKEYALGGYWSRGHLCMSRERGGADTQLNRQTFYPTNIAPQASSPSTFAAVWGYVESLFSGTRDTSNRITADDGAVNVNVVADTLYIVAGCWYEHDNWIEKDASDNGRLSGDSKDCVMPTHQFKMALRTKAGNTGKNIRDCTAAELQAVAFWIESRTMRTATDADLSDFAVPVSFVEQKTGMTFFPDAPSAVKEHYNAADWGF